MIDKKQEQEIKYAAKQDALKEEKNIIQYKEGSSILETKKKTEKKEMHCFLQTTNSKF
mgnify:CR=1 FL=1